MPYTNGGGCPRRVPHRTSVHVVDGRRESRPLLEARRATWSCAIIAACGGTRSSACTRATPKRCSATWCSTGDRALAEDLLADTFERVLRSRARFDPRRASEKTWLYTIALNLVRDHARRAGVERRALETVGATEDRVEGVEEAEVRGDLNLALRQLSLEDREIVALRFGADLTLPQIAKVTRQPRTTVEGRFYRAVRKLREQMD